MTSRGPTRRRALRFLITAGPTREYLDPVRYLSNESSGKQGFAVAAAAVRRGHAVTLVHGPVALRPPRGVAAVAVVSAADMLRACRAHWPKCDVLIMVAAVADYSPAAPARTKRKKSAADLVLRLRPTTDILATLSRSRRADQAVIGFAAPKIAPAAAAPADKLARKQLDAIVLNPPAALSADRAAWAILVRGEKWQCVPPMSKTRFAVRLVRLAESLAVSRL